MGSAGSPGDGGGAQHLGKGVTKNNTSIENLNRPAVQDREKSTSGSVAFRGIPDKLVKFVENPKFNKVIQNVINNEAMYSAFVTLVLVSTLRPVLTLLMPVADGKDKVTVASKEVVSGVVGFGLATLIANPISKGVEKFLKTPAKFITDNNELIKKVGKQTTEEGHHYVDTFKSFFKNMPDMANGMIKAGITIALMPFVIKIIDKIRGDKNDKSDKTTEFSAEDNIIFQNVHRMTEEGKRANYLKFAETGGGQK